MNEQDHLPIEQFILYLFSQRAEVIVFLGNPQPVIEHGVGTRAHLFELVWDTSMVLELPAELVESFSELEHSLELFLPIFFPLSS